MSTGVTLLQYIVSPKCFHFLFPFFARNAHELAPLHAQVPVIKQGDMVMPDSDKIVVWLEEQFPLPSMKSKAPEGL